MHPSNACLSKTVCPSKFYSSKPLSPNNICPKKPACLSCICSSKSALATLVFPRKLVHPINVCPNKPACPNNVYSSKLVCRNNDNYQSKPISPINVCLLNPWFAIKPLIFNLFIVLLIFFKFFLLQHILSLA